MSADEITPQSLQFANAINEVAKSLEVSDEIVTRIEQQEARIAILRNALDTLVHVVGLTAIKYPSQLPPLQGDQAVIGYIGSDRA